MLPRIGKNTNRGQWKIVQCYSAPALDYSPNANSGERMTFQEAFKRSIDESGATITEVAAATGVSRDQLYKLYHGRARRTNVDDAVQIAAYFGTEHRGLHRALGSVRPT